MTRQVEHNQTLVARFSDVMRLIGDINLIKYAPRYNGDESERTPGWGGYTDAEVTQTIIDLGVYTAQKATLRAKIQGPFPFE